MVTCSPLHRESHDGIDRIGGFGPRRVTIILAVITLLVLVASAPGALAQRVRQCRFLSVFARLVRGHSEATDRTG